jgi:alkylation response protein AidB-like acyl-CoA dehydrogenase
VQLILSEDQELLAKTAADFVQEHSPVSRFRALRDARDPVGYSPALWRQMAELGWVGIPIPEAYGGAEMGLAELCCVLEPLGGALAPEPMLSTVLLGAGALVRAGSEAQKKAWLPRVAEGDAILALAHQEPGSRYRVCHVATRAEPAGDGFVLRGEKIQVLDAPSAHALLVPARTAGETSDAEGISLFLVAPDASGLARTPQVRVDHRAAGLVSLDGVRVGADAVVGEVGAAGPLLEDVVDAATVGLCAEMLGLAERAFALTLDYLKTREQFDVPIGSFQALKHRAAQVFIELQLARSTVMAAARALDAGDAEAPALVSLAKARCSDTALLAGNEGVQMFGGVGMTDEYDIGLYLKRARAAQLTFGDAAWHRERWARLRGY